VKTFTESKEPKGYLDFRKYVINLKSIPPFWGNPPVDLPRIEDVVIRKVEEVLAPQPWSDDLGFWYFNRHDRSHIKRTICFLWQLQEFLKRKQIKLTPYESYILYIAALGHDLGMSPWPSELFDAYEKASRGKINTNKIRKFHGSAGASILEEILKPYIKKEDLRAVIGEIVSYHSGKAHILKPIIEIDGKEIRKAVLIALLRIADTMDAGRERLPGDEIIAQSIALASTCPDPFGTQFEHYMRRYLVLSCFCNSSEKEDNKEKGIILRVKKEFPNFIVENPEGKRGKSVTITGEKAFLGLLKEFAKELGLPENYNELKDEYPNLKWNDLEKTAKIRTSNRLLETQIGLKIPWEVEFIGDPKGVIPNLWQKDAKAWRERFDKEPHVIEKLLDTNFSIQEDSKTKDQSININHSVIIGGKVEHSIIIIGDKNKVKK